MEKNTVASLSRNYRLIAAINITTILSIGFLVFCRKLGILDEIWLYAYSKNIADGLHLYTDISLCTTPLVFWIQAAFLSVFGSSLWVFRFLSFTVYATLYLWGSRIIKNKTEGYAFVQFLYAFYIKGFNGHFEIWNDYDFYAG